MTSIRHLLALVSVAALAANPACAQSPAATGSATPLRLVVGFPPGGHWTRWRARWPTNCAWLARAR